MSMRIKPAGISSKWIFLITKSTVSGSPTLRKIHGKLSANKSIGRTKGFNDFHCHVDGDLMLYRLIAKNQIIETLINPAERKMLTAIEVTTR